MTHVITNMHQLLFQCVALQTSLAIPFKAVSAALARHIPQIQWLTTNTA